MKTKRNIRTQAGPLAFLMALIVLLVQNASAALISNIIETGGDNEATDTIAAKWTGTTFPVSVNNEPVIGLVIGDNYTVGAFDNGSPAFVDRNHYFTNASDTVLIPDYLLGGEVIMSGNDNRDNNPYTLDVTVSQRVNVYMLIDNRLNDGDGLTPPTFTSTNMQWIVDEGWAAVTTGNNRTADNTIADEIGIDEGADGTINQWYSIYSKTFDAGTFQLKQAENTGRNMYGAVVTAAPAQEQLVWAVGMDDDAWPLDLLGGGANAAFVQETGTNPLPGAPDNPVAAQQGDDDYYFAGVYTTVIPGNGDYVPLGVVAVNEAGAERAFAGTDNDLRYHFNLPASLSPGDHLSVTFDALNLHIDAAANPDPRYGVEVYFNGVKVQDEIVIRPADLGTDYTTALFSLASVNAQVGPGFDNIVTLKGINHNAEGGGNWMGIDYVQLNSNSDPNADLVRGVLKKERYDNIGGGVALADLLSNEKYINNTPDYTCFRTDFSANDADECDNCGFKISGYFIPTASGPHTFYIAADDGAGLFLSTDENPANKVQIAAEPVWTGRKNYIGGDGDGTGTGRGDPPANISAPIELVAGKVYYIEGAVKEGGGGDNLDVAVQGPGDPPVQDGDLGISGDRIAARFDLTGSSLAITQNPANAQVIEGNSATFTVVATATSPLCGGVPTYQWQRDEVDIPGANAATYTVATALSSDHLSTYRCVVKILGITRTSTAATLEVFASECLQVVSAAGSFGRTSVSVVFSSLLDPIADSTVDVFNYTITGSDGSAPVVIEVRLNPDGKSVTLTTDELAENPQYTVTVENVTSFVGSLVCASPDNQATILPYASSSGGYSATVQADGPIAYWRFNDVLPTAINSGSLGAAADGTYNGDAAPGDEALRPPAFPGLEAGNTAAQFDGNGDFVGTAISLMNGRPVFTMTGWMRRNADQNNRTGLWGQNDIVEFGYINNDTIELWTDNGLHQSPDPTVNPIPNGEWAHFAVVSTGSPGTALLYTNGVLANTREHTVPADNAFFFNIGGGGIFDAAAANGNFFNGQIDEVAVYDKALVADQIERQYRAAFQTPGITFDDCQTPPGTTLFSGVGAVPDTEPSTQRGYIGDDGSGQNCVLHLTDAGAASAYGIFLIENSLGDAIVNTISVKWRSLIGGGDAGGADGYSFSWAADLPNPPTYGNPGEEGAGSGLRFNVDTWDNGGGDLPGIEIKYAGAQVAFKQLGKDVAIAPDTTYLRKSAFVNAEASVDATGLATFTYDGVTITAVLPGWGGIRGGSYMFGARTGGANDNMWIDDLIITAQEAVGGASVTITQQPVDQSFLLNAPAGVTLLDQNFDADDGGFATVTPAAYDGPWVYDAATGSWGQNGQQDENSRPNTSMLNSPSLTVTKDGLLTLGFAHKYSFEDGFWDGGQVRVSVNGGPYETVPGSAFSANGYNGGVLGNSASDLKGQSAFVETSVDYANTFLISVANLGSFTAGDTVSVQFIAASDTNTRGPNVPNWQITSVNITEGVSPTSVTFTTGANAFVPGMLNPPLTYQWNRNGNPIPGATAASYTFVPVIADNGAKYHVVVSTTGASATSDEATLTVSGVSEPNTPPQFACGPNQGVNEDAGAQTVIAWATDILPHSITREPILYGGDFSALPEGSVISGAAAVADGILHLTDAVNGVLGSFATPALPLVESLTVTFKARIGGGTCCGARTADGWSLSIGDIALPPTFALGAAEEGTPGGLVVSFDSWDNGGDHPDTTHTAPNADIKANGSIVAYQAFVGEREGGRAPSGPFILDPATGADMTYTTGEAFVDVRVHLDPDGTLDVDFKGVRIFDNVATGLPMPLANARLLLAARTGGANDNHWIDDLNIVATVPDASSAELGQSVVFNVSNDNASLFSEQPAVTADGILTYTPAANASGVANVTVVAMDDGGTANGGVDTSASCTFTITVAPVCDLPVAVNDNGGETTGTAPLTINVLANDSDIEGGLVVGAVTQGANGAVVNNGSSVTYTAGAGFSGVDTFTYTAVNSCGAQSSAIVTVTVLPGSEPPTAVIGTEALVDFSPDFENPVLISCNWWNACLVLDGWTSSSPGGGDLTYLWFSEPDPVPFGAGPMVTNCYEVGTHTIILTVTDSAGLTATDSKTIEVVTAPLAIELLIEKINESLVERKTKRELVASLRTAQGHAGKENIRATQQALDVFEKKVRAQVAPNYPEEARVWILWTQATSQGMEKCITKLPKHVKHHYEKKKEARGDK